jgi:hypothetical protein
MTSQDLAKLLNEQPDPNFLKTRSGFSYLPISYIQTKLDEIYGIGLWGFSEPKIIIVANEMIGTIELSVFHPVANTWVKRAGVAAVMIRQKSGADICDISAKIKNSLEMDSPHLLTDCIKSAVKSLGKVFGRDLNREFVDNYDLRTAVEIDGENHTLSLPKLPELTTEHPNFVKVKTALQGDYTIEQVRSKYFVSPATENLLYDRPQIQ